MRNMWEDFLKIPARFSDSFEMQENMMPQIFWPILHGYSNISQKHLPPVEGRNKNTLCIFQLLCLDWGLFVLVGKGSIWVKVFENEPSKVCGRQPLKIWSNVVCLRPRKSLNADAFHVVLLEVSEAGTIRCR